MSRIENAVLEAESLKRLLREAAMELGFTAFGVASVPADLRADYFVRWLERGCHGDMDWMLREPRRRMDVTQVLPEACSVICLGFNYFQTEPARRGRIAKYALGRDYHNFLLKRLKKLCLILRAQGGIQRPYVDTGPILEKPWAAAAGLGWQGKNTLLLHPRAGQWLLLGVILTTLSLPADKPIKDHCGSCMRCVDVCPTKAITGPYQLDARLCISYLTIEHKGSIPVELRPLVGHHLFGCDDCLDVCPWNRWAQKTVEPQLLPKDYPDPGTMLYWDECTFQSATSGTPIKRLGLSRWRRNICVVLGNIGTAQDLPALEFAAGCGDPLVEEHALWALERLS